MTKKHDRVFDDVLKGLGDADEEGRGPEDRAEARFLKRSSALAEQAGGVRQEKVLRLVDPGVCRMWEGHNRAYELLNEGNCADLIAGLKAQGKQEFPAIVRRLRPSWQEGQGPEYEVICGARRHFAVTWLRANNYPQFGYLIEERELTDEEAFRLADIENRDREDISDLERARDYARALESYYGGRQKAMAERLEASPTWLSRYLDLARLDDRIVAAFPSLREVRELHARQLKPLIATEEGRAAILAEADRLAAERKEGAGVPAAEVVARLKRAAAPQKPRAAADRVYRRAPQESGIQMRRKGQRIMLEFDRGISAAALRAALEAFLADRQKG